MDCYSWGLTAEDCYECLGAGKNSSNVLFSTTVTNSHNVMYSYHIANSKNIFGCVSLRGKQYCIFNKQYTKKQYEVLLEKIIRHMQETHSTSSGPAGEWGEFFPMSICPLSYNISIAQDVFPLTKKEIEAKGYNWCDKSDAQIPKTHVMPYKLPDSIQDTPDSLSDEFLTCEKSKKLYQIIPQELAFYKEHNIPVPRLCFTERYLNRVYKRHSPKLHNRHCEKCKTPLKTIYSSSDPEHIFCETCYKKAIHR